MKDTWGAVLLAGGRGRRMGLVHKAELSYKGREFGERIRDELECLGVPVFLSEAAYKSTSKDWKERGWILVEDGIRGENGELAGPMGGIWSCLKEAEKLGLKGLFFVSCDMPLFRKEMALELQKRGKDKDAVLWKTRDGRLHPACGYYSVSCLPVLEKRIKDGNYRMMDFISSLSQEILETSSVHLPDRWFLNVNRPEIYSRLNASSVPVLAVSGRKNTGKTTFLEQLVKELSARGLSIAVIKHDGHDFVPDTPGTDSFRMKQAGAYGTVVFSGNRFSLVKDSPGHKAEDFFGCFPEADLILLEGAKGSSYPKFEMLRREVSFSTVCRQETVLAYVTDFTKEELEERGFSFPGKPVYSFGDREEILEETIRFMDGAT